MLFYLAYDVQGCRGLQRSVGYGRLAIGGDTMAKQVQFTLDDKDHERALVYCSDKHLSYQAALAFEEWLKRREARTRRAEKQRGEK